MHWRLHICKITRKDLSPYVHGRHQAVCKNEKELEILPQNIHLGYWNGIWHEKIYHLLNEKWRKQITDIIDLSNEETFKTPGKKKNYKYLRIFEADIIKQAETKKKETCISDERENFSKPNTAAGISSKGYTPEQYLL